MSLSIERSPLLVDSLSADHICDALSGLTKPTRQIVKEELEKAILDTSVDYHKEPDRGAQQLMAKEIFSMTELIKIIVKVDKELEDGNT